MGTSPTVLSSAQHEPELKQKSPYACTRVRVYHFVPACILSLNLLQLLQCSQTIAATPRTGVIAAPRTGVIASIAVAS